MKKVSIKDIARQAKVSVATVSLVLNGKEKDGRVSKEVADRVRKIASELNYYPNALARGLQSGRTYVIGLIVADISNPFFGNLAYYIQDQMEKAGYSVMIMNTNEDEQQLKKTINMLKNHQVDGYIIVPTGQGEDSIRELQETKKPLVLLDRCYTGLETHCVMADGYQASSQAVDLLLEKGCRRIGLLAYNNLQTHMTDRKRGYTDALTRAGLFDPELIEPVNFSNLEKEIEAALPRLLKKGIDGLFMATNTISLLALKELFRKGIGIPRQIRVVCFDKSEAFEFMKTPVPYIQQPIEVMGRKAADLLLEQIDGKETHVQICKYPATLIRRDE